MDVETIHRTFDKPAFDLVGHGLGRANKAGERLGKTQRRLAQGQALITGDLLDVFGMAAIAVAAQVAQLREGFIQWVLAEVVVVERPPQLHQRFVQVQLAIALAVDGLGLFVGVGNDRRNARQDGHVIRVTSGGSSPFFDVAVIRLGVFEIAHAGKNAFGVIRCQAAAGLGNTRLENHRLALG